MPKTILNNLEITEAEVEDFNKIFQLLKLLWPGKNLKQEKILGKYKNEIKSKSKLYFLIGLEEKIVGFYSLRNIKQKTILYIDELIVDTQFRNIGIGTKTMETIIIYAKENKYKKIQLHSNFRRKNAHNFYQKLGFNKGISLTSLLKGAYIFTKII